MNHLDSCDPTQILGSEKARLRALSLTLIRSVVQQHHGRIMGDQISESIDISVPEGQEAICAEEIGEQMGLICHHMYSQVDALFRGEVLIQFAEN